MNARLLLLALLLASPALTACPPAGDDDDDSAATDDDDATGDDDDATGDDDDVTGDDDDATGDDDDSAGDDDDSAGDDDDSTSAVFAPTEGNYDYGLIMYGQNNCSANQTTVGDGFALGGLNTTNETFSLTSTDAGVPVSNCYFDQTQAYVCNQTNASYNLGSIGMPQATISRSDTNGGSWTSSTVAAVSNSITLNCGGAQCATAAQVMNIQGGWPCTTTFTTTATFIVE